MADVRDSAEIASNYPPRKSTMVRRCTVPIIGEPNEWLFDEVTGELLTFLSSPGLTREALFEAFRDTAGTFVAPSLHNAGKGRFFRGRRAKAPKRLVDADPQSWLDILRIKDIGEDSYYDMFNMMLVRWVHRFGQCLPIFVAADGLPLDGLDLTILSGPGIASPVIVRVEHGVGFDAGGVFAFPHVGEYVVGDTTSTIRIEVPVATAVTRVGVASDNSLRVFHDPEIVTLSVHPARQMYPAKHEQNHLTLFDKSAIACGSCDKFAFVKQEDLERAPVQTVATDPQQDSAAMLSLPPGRYVVAGHSDKGIIVTTVRDVVIDAGSVREVGLDHSFDLSRLDTEPPQRAFLQGDMVQQRQRNTQWCGLYSLAHAFSYWAPLRYNPMGDNGQWAGENITDGWTTWAHTFVSIATFGIAPAVFSVFADDPSPGTLQETMTVGARRYGFSYQGYTYDSLGKSEALKQLKRWIHAGVPVIVTVDELMDQGDGHFSSEHYKVIVGYDDEARLRYTDDAAVEHVSTGAFYFQNSGGQGETRSDPQVLDPNLRETHADYAEVPIGNEADSYTVFWQKWKTGGIPSFSDSYWCLPIYPIDFIKAYAPRPQE